MLEAYVHTNRDGTWTRIRIKLVDTWVVEYIVWNLYFRVKPLVACQAEQILASDIEAQTAES